MRRYKVVAERSPRTGGWWAIDVPDLTGVFSQSRRLDQVSGMARDAIAAFLGVSADEIEVDVVSRLPTELESLVFRAARVREAADLMQREATDLTRAAVEGLAHAGLSVRDIGRIVGLSHQRAAQILSEPSNQMTGKLVDLMEALEASVNAAKLAREDGSRASRSAGRRAEKLDAAG